MVVFRKIFALIFVVFLNIASAHADLLTECNISASQINKSTPQTLDKVTTLLNATCYQDGGAVVLQYRNRLSVPSGSVDQSKLNTIKPNMIAAWCSDPTQRATLNLVNIQYTYSEMNGKLIGKIDISTRDCR